MAFSTDVTIRFAHVDAAGIVFYPRYFEMLNGAVEDWFASMGWDFRKMHLTRNMGVPTVKLECDFLAPSELGETVTITIVPTSIGRSSCAVTYVVSGGGKERLRASGVLVCMNLAEKKSMPWPAELREALTNAAAA